MLQKLFEKNRKPQGAVRREIYRLQSGIYFFLRQTDRRAEYQLGAKKLIDNYLPLVVFHSFRHSSITYKLKLNGGDMKSVQEK